MKVHVKVTLRKIRVNNRTQAAIWAIDNDGVIGGANNHSDPTAVTASQPSTPRSVVLTRSEAPGFASAYSPGFIQQTWRANGDKPIGSVPTFTAE